MFFKLIIALVIDLFIYTAMFQDVTGLVSETNKQKVRQTIFSYQKVALKVLNNFSCHITFGVPVRVLYFFSFFIFSNFMCTLWVALL